MSCYVNEQEGTIEAVLTFKRDQLLYDVKNAAYAEGHVMPPETKHSQHMVKDIGEEGNVDRVTRVFELEIARCREMLYPYTKHDVHKPVLDNKFKELESYGIVMHVPLTFSQTTLVLLERLVHNYLVDKALADWMSITNPGKTETWLAKAAEAESEIRTTINSRMKRSRIKPHWL